MLDELIEKWSDAAQCADDWVERNLIEEFLGDLKWLDEK